LRSFHETEDDMYIHISSVVSISTFGLLGSRMSLESGHDLIPLLQLFGVPLHKLAKPNERVKYILWKD